MNGGEIVARVLKEEHVKFLFTLCGGHISPILVGAKRAGIRVVDTRHECNAVFAADAVARLTGIPGVTAVTAGPGITNSITAIHNALMAQSPLVLLGGAAPTLLKGRGALQDIDQMSLVKPTVKWAAAVRKEREIYPVLKRAFQESKAGVPGPVFVELPVDLLYDESLVRDWYVKASSAKASLTERITSWYINRHVEKMFSGVDNFAFTKKTKQPLSYTSSQLGKSIGIINSARQPVLLVGSGALMNPTEAPQLAAALSKLNIPTYLSGMARGLLGENSAQQYRHHRKEALREADVVILAGVPCDFRLDYGRHIGRKTKLLSVNRSATDLTKNRKPDVGILADPMDFLIGLANHAHSFKSDGWADWKMKLNEREKDRELKINEEAQLIDETQGINPVKLFIDLNNKLSPDAVIIADGGDFVGTSSYIIKPRRPLSWLDPGVFGTLGIGGGFALGAKLVYPEADVFILYGDGSSAYSLMEFDTFVRHGIPVTAIIGNDASWSQIARDQIEILKDDCGTVLASSQYELVAKAFGAAGRKVNNIEDFNLALNEAQASVKQGIPYIINAVLAKSAFRKGSLSM
ncbi:MAG: thiamine pyrophosphate-binding protein [Cyclobacteriaceae bacterium]|nr:thiamine pyrophosphate-binding protein [Cyclobacteriaceae bacterium]MDH4297448.1 thiamine pyrophosphate-binding protein [Cyclobacteriaceae bacterium]MDH5250872.1 thiamine pyrophosphate-binding protein [Cyclobacteriaceae bacterium]